MATTHVDPVRSAVTAAARTPTGVTLATVVSRATNVAMGGPVDGFVAKPVSATISCPSASKPSTQTDQFAPADSVSHAWVAGQRSRAGSIPAPGSRQ